MSYRRYLSTALGAVAWCIFAAPAGLAAEGAHQHWSYDGAGGPSVWGELDTSNKACGGGSQQSPINLTNAVPARMEALSLDWKGRADTIVNNGHTIQVNFKPGSKLTIGKSHFDLLQLHFHHQSEHQIDGKNFPMEAHFVHRNDKGLAVLGVMMTPGPRNPAFAKIVAAMPSQEGPPVKLEAAFNAKRLLPAGRRYFRYEGSLTTPPCSEVVDWLVLTSPVTVAKSDIDAFAKLYPMNARPTQNDNRRFVLRSN